MKWPDFIYRVQGAEPREERSLSTNQWAQMFSWNGLQYPITTLNQTQGLKQEEPASSFGGYAEQLFKQNPVVYACVVARMRIFSEARFQFRELRSGRPGDLFGTAALGPLEVPEPNRTTGDLLSRALMDVDLEGNWYGLRQGKQIRRLRPDWVTIVLGSYQDPKVTGADLNGELLGYVYHPGGHGSGKDPVGLLPDEVAHFAPTPDPTALYRGMSWLTPVVREIMGDSAATQHKLSFFENGATPNMIVTLNPDISVDAFSKWIEMFEARYGKGAADAYQTIFLGGGASADVVGSNMREISFKETQGAGETRIAAAAEVPPIIAGFAEGLESATYSNYGQARRKYADATMRPLWRSMAGSLASIIRVPGSSELWYDDRDIPFLQEDMKDGAEIQESQGRTIKLLVEAGFTPDSARDSVMAGDLKRLKHSGLVSVQLLPPGTEKPPVGGPKPPPAIEAGSRLLAGLLPRGD